jgi:uncharacterized protein (DUF111 family)
VTVAWVDASAGASGDMLLGALIDAGVPLRVITAAIDAVSPEPVELSVERVTRGGLAATRCHVDGADSTSHRTWRDVRALLAALPENAEGDRLPTIAGLVGEGGFQPAPSI